MPPVPRYRRLLAPRLSMMLLAVVGPLLARLAPIRPVARLLVARLQTVVQQAAKAERATRLQVT